MAPQSGVKVFWRFDRHGLLLAWLVSLGLIGTLPVSEAWAVPKTRTGATLAKPAPVRPQASPARSTPTATPQASPVPPGQGVPGLSPLSPAGSQSGYGTPMGLPAYQGPDPYAPARHVPSSVQVPAPPVTETVLLILDASYSMTERLEGGETKMAVAKRVLLDTLRAIPPTTYVGLRIYGYSANPITACSASKLMVPFGQHNQAIIASALVGLRPTGETPISLSLQQAVQQDLSSRPGKKTIVLLTDGLETCDADPCRVAVQLVRAGSDVRINTVALGLGRDFDALRQLKCISAATYGQFYSANTAAELAEGLARSMSVQTNVNAQIMPKFRP